MKQSNPMWAGISILTGAVLAIFAFVRGKWMIPLLASAFGIWVLWVFWILGVPVLQKKRAQRKLDRHARKEAAVKRKEEAARLKQETAARNTETKAEHNPEIAQALLRHVNYRISDQLRASYPNARWEWKVTDPAALAVHGGIGRIRLYGVPDYEYADVELERNGKLSCSLVKSLSVLSTPPVQPPQPPNRQEVDPRDWYEAHGRDTLEALIADLDSRGHNCLSLKEDGSICVHPVDGGDETVEDTLCDFPDKSGWTKLVKVLEQTGLAATAQADRITVAW